MDAGRTFGAAFDAALAEAGARAALCAGGLLLLGRLSGSRRR